MTFCDVTFNRIAEQRLGKSAQYLKIVSEFSVKKSILQGILFQTTFSNLAPLQLLHRWKMLRFFPEMMCILLLFSFTKFSAYMCDYFQNWCKVRTCIDLARQFRSGGLTSYKTSLIFYLEHNDGSVANDDDLTKRAKQHVRENAFKKESPNMTVRSIFLHGSMMTFSTTQHLNLVPLARYLLKLAGNWCNQWDLKSRRSQRASIVDHERADVIEAHGMQMASLGFLHESNADMVNLLPDVELSLKREKTTFWFHDQNKHVEGWYNASNQTKRERSWLDGIWLNRRERGLRTWHYLIPAHVDIYMYASVSLQNLWVLPDPGWILEQWSFYWADGGRHKVARQNISHASSNMCGCFTTHAATLNMRQMFLWHLGSRTCHERHSVGWATTKASWTWCTTKGAVKGERHQCKQLKTRRHDNNFS